MFKARFIGGSENDESYEMSSYREFEYFSLGLDIKNHLEEYRAVFDLEGKYLYHKATGKCIK